MNNQAEMMDVITDMFLDYPAAKNTSIDQVKRYVDSVSPYPVSVVRRVCEKFGNGEYQRDCHTYPPSRPELMGKLKIEGMTKREVIQLQSARNAQQAIAAPTSDGC